MYLYNFSTFFLPLKKIYCSKKVIYSSKKYKNSHNQHEDVVMALSSISRDCLIYHLILLIFKNLKSPNYALKLC